MISAAEIRHILVTTISGYTLIIQAHTDCRCPHTMHHICVHTFSLTVTTWIFWYLHSNAAPCYDLYCIIFSQQLVTSWTVNLAKCQEKDGGLNMN